MISTFTLDDMKDPREGEREKENYKLAKSILFWSKEIHNVCNALE
jgi:hypothetical protein